MSTACAMLTIEIIPRSPLESAKSDQESRVSGTDQGGRRQKGVVPVAKRGRVVGVDKITEEP